MYTYRRVLAHPLRFELRSHGFGNQDNNRYTKGVQDTSFILLTNEKLVKT